MSEPERTADGRYLVIDGRRWRASDPEIPEPLRKELVGELMAARRAVRDAAGEEDEHLARRRVQDAKVALGERGAPWWEELDGDQRSERLEAAIRALLRARRVDSTICPSDAARIAGGKGWRSSMPLARAVAAELARAGELEITAGGAVVDPSSEPSGPIRLGRAPAFR